MATPRTTPLTLAQTLTHTVLHYWPVVCGVQSYSRAERNEYVQAPRADAASSHVQEKGL